MSTVAKILLYDKVGNVLIMSRSDTHPKYPLEADLPGGEVEDGEAIDDAVCREVAEEAGLHIEPASVQLVHDRITPEGRRDTLFATTLDSEKPNVTISWEHSAYEWIAADDALDHLDTTDDYMLVVREYLAKQHSDKIEVV